MNTENQSIYICGPVTGTTDYIERFAKVEKELNNSFYGMIINPVRKCQLRYTHPENIDWTELMIFVISWYLKNCTHIYLMSGWEKSHGARIEQLWAEKLQLIEIREIPKTDGHFCEFFKKECIKNYGKECPICCSRNNSEVTK